jgi:large subunit ribosomal protein L43
VNGDRNWMSARNQTREEIEKWVNLMKLQHGDTTSARYRKHWQTEQPSIQGPWTPFTHRNPPNNLVEYPDLELGEVLNKEQTATEKLLEMVKSNQISARPIQKVCKDE